jgi:ribosome-associated translation inhibitor RaiA
MKVTLNFDHIEPAGQPRLREIFNTHVRRLRSRLEAYATPELAHLEGRIDRHPEQPEFRVSLRLRLSHGLITADGEGTDVRSVLTAFEAIERQLERHPARWRSPHDAARPTSRISLMH